MALHFYSPLFPRGLAEAGGAVVQWAGPLPPPAHFVKAAAAHSLNTPPIPKGQCQHSELSHTYSTHTPSQRRKIVSFNWVRGGSFYSNWGWG